MPIKNLRTIQDPSISVLSMPVPIFMPTTTQLIPMFRLTICLKIKEPALDLAVAVAILSSYFDETVSSGAAWCGELGLSGEIRPVHHLEQRVEEVVRVGCSSLYMPPAKKELSKEKCEKCTIHSLTDLQGAEKVLRHVK